MKPRILVIRGGAIGDFILTLPAIGLLRENFPNAHLEILGYKHIISLAEARFYADATRSIEYGALASFFIPGGELPPELIHYFGSFQQIVSYLYDPDQFFEANILRCGVKHFLHVPPKLDDSAHAAQQLARPLERLALFLEDAAAKVHPSAEDRRFAADFLSGAAEPILAVHPGSGSDRKNWPVEHWVELGGLLGSSQRGPSILLIGGEADAKNVAALRNGWARLPLLLAQNLPLPHLAAVVEQCTMFLGHDSGISHLAAAVGTPCLLMFGPTDHQIWSPANRNVTVQAAPGGDLKKLTPSQVYAGVLDLLGKERR